MRELLAMTLLLGLAAGCRTAHAPAAPRPFTVYNALLYRQQPDFAGLPFPRIRLVYGQELWAKGIDRAQPDLATVQTTITALPKLDAPVVLDIEHWPVHGDEATVAASLAKYLEVLRAARGARPDLAFGYYGVAPLRDYWTPVSKDPAKLAAWRTANERVTPLAKEVDAVFPSLYTFYDDPAGWEVYARANLAAARRYGKPIYAFLWPQYHDSNKQLAGQDLPADGWARQLAVCRELADGVVIWGGYQQDWDEQAPWWQATRRFLAALPRAR